MSHISKALKREGPYRSRGQHEEKGYDEIYHHPGALSDKLPGLLRHRREGETPPTLTPQI